MNILSLFHCCYYFSIFIKRIVQASAPFCKKLSLELGGKNPNIIFDDANLEECVATSIRSSFANQGEICLCGSRIFVQEGIYQKFMEKFIEKVPLSSSSFHPFKTVLTRYNNRQSN